MEIPDDESARRTRLRFPKFQWQLRLDTMFWLVAMFGLWLAWYRDRTQLEGRLRVLELSLNPPAAWSIQQCFGPPDDLGGNGTKSWCPRPSQSQEWLQLEYDRSVRSAMIEIHETYSTGCVTKVCFVDSMGHESVVWEGTDPTPKGGAGVFKIRVAAGASKTNRVKVYLNNAGWSCIDAVGLRDSRGNTIWASSATASSSYGR